MGSARIDRLVDELTTDEKADLVTGLGIWTTRSVERLGIPSMTVTDGPNGARGGGLMGTGRSLLVDPEGHILATGGEGEEYLNQVLDLDRVRTVREHGTYGMIRMWQQLRDAPPPPMPAYQEGFAAGAIMDGRGPLEIPQRARAGSGSK